MFSIIKTLKIIAILSYVSVNVTNAELTTDPQICKGADWCYTNASGGNVTDGTDDVLRVYISGVFGDD